MVTFLTPLAENSLSQKDCLCFVVSMRTKHRDQASFCPFALREDSVFAEELVLEHLRYSLTDVPP